MQFSKKIERCELSPIRKFYPYAEAAKAQGKRIYQLNIGQPDIETPKAFYDAIRNFSQPVLSYAPSPGMSSSSMPCEPIMIRNWVWRLM